MSPHDKVITFILSDSASLFLAGSAFLLAILYFIDLLLVSRGYQRIFSKYGVFARIVNWVAFGFVFLLFGRIIPLKDLLTWRASARLLLMFLILSEMLFLVVTMIPALKRKPWKKET